ncbi:MAG: transposase [bacterium]|nr:transposase [bacterium]MBU1427245.1 transposase [bacterium]MBU2440101.1 transposase [bacterium]
MYKLIFQFLKLGKRSKGYFVSTIGKVSAETIRKYIQEQKTKE